MARKFPTGPCKFFIEIFKSYNHIKDEADSAVIKRGGKYAPAGNKFAPCGIYSPGKSIFQIGNQVRPGPAKLGTETEKEKHLYHYSHYISMWC
jgi:hypothetical protein